MYHRRYNQNITTYCCPFKLHFTRSSIFPLKYNEEMQFDRTPEQYPHTHASVSHIDTSLNLSRLTRRVKQRHRLTHARGIYSTEFGLLRHSDHDAPNPIPLRMAPGCRFCTGGRQAQQNRIKSKPTVACSQRVFSHVYLFTIDGGSATPGDNNTQKTT